MSRVAPECRSVLIGSLPLRDHQEAFRWISAHTPDIPLWAQLPKHRQEGMMIQFLEGMPGLSAKDDTPFIDTNAEDFQEAVLGFYEEYMSVADNETDIGNSRFTLSRQTARGFYVFMENIGALTPPPFAVKGQITGPVTLGIGIKDPNGKSIFYDEQLRDALVKLVAMKAQWQVQQLKRVGCPVLLFFDEPALAGFGSSAFISISTDEIRRCFQEVVEAIHGAGALAGIHVCANTDWSLLLDSSADIVSFDAYSYFDNFLLYPKPIKGFLDRGGILAWGIVPTAQAEDIDRETPESLISKWEDRFGALRGIGASSEQLFSQSLISPSCGTGSLDAARAERVLRLTRDVSGHLRRRFLDTRP